MEGSAEQNGLLVRDIRHVQRDVSLSICGSAVNKCAILFYTIAFDVMVETWLVTILSSCDLVLGWCCLVGSTAKNQIHKQI